MALLTSLACMLPLDGAPCPCAAGYTCCDGVCTEGVCLRQDPGAAIRPQDRIARTLPHGASASMFDFVPMFAVRDFVHDAQRQRLYLTGMVREGEAAKLYWYDLRARGEPTLLEVPGDLWALALSPDARYLVAADVAGADTTGQCHVLDLESETPGRSVSFGLEAHEGRPFSVLFLDDRNVAVSTARTEPAAPDAFDFPLRAFDAGSLAPHTLVDDEGAAVRVSPGSVLTRSGDGAYLLAAQTDSAIGRLVRYRLQTGELQRTWSNLNFGGAALNRDGSGWALTSYGGLVLDDAGGRRRAADALWDYDAVRGAVYRPDNDLLYLSRGVGPWAIEVFHPGIARTVHVVESDAAQLEAWTDARTFDVGRLRLSADGRWLFAHVKQGVGVYRVGDEGDEPDATVPPSPEEEASDDVHQLPESAAYTVRVPVFDARDVTYDSAREVVYATTFEEGVYGSIVRWPHASMSEPERLPLDGRFTALEVSPGHERLAVVDRNAFPGHVRIQLLDLNDQRSEALDLPSGPYEGVERAAHDVVFLDDDTLLVSSNALDGAEALLPLRRVDLRDGSVQVVRDIAPEALFSRSADGSQVLVSWVSYDPRTADHYYPQRPLDQAYVVGTHAVKPYGLSLSRDGSQAAIVARTGVSMFDEQSALLDIVAELTESVDEVLDPRPFSVAYSPVADLLYVTWGGFLEPEGLPSIDAYDTRTFAQTAVMEPASDLYWHSKELPFAAGRMHVADDGAYLFVTGVWGIGMYELAPDGTPRRD